MVAACVFDLQGSTGEWQQILPAGTFSARDGRPVDAPAWRLDATLAATLIAQFSRRVNAAVVDYEHQTLHAEVNGVPAPAAGWINELQWREGQGLFAKIEWTAKAREMIQAGEYRYLSPVFQYAPGTGDVLTLEMAAVTNYPGLDGMQALAAMRSIHHPTEEHPVDLLKMLIEALGLEPNTTEDDAIAALKKVAADNTGFVAMLTALRQELGAEEGAGLDALKARVAALKSGGTQGGETPDPAKYVSVKVVEDLRAELAALSGQFNSNQLEELVSEGLEDGRLLKAQEPWARDLGKKDIQALKAYLETAQPIAALRSTQTNGVTTQVDDNGLDAEELAVCRSMGIDPEEYAKSKPGYKPAASGTSDK